MTTKLRLAILTSHPIQYYAPVFRALADSTQIEPCVFYTWSQAARGQIVDPGFAIARQWDIPLLEGYQYEFVQNISRDPGTHHFWGLRNPTLFSAIQRWRPDALLVYGWNYWSHLRAMLHFKGKVPVFFRGDSTLLDEQPMLRKGARRLALRWVYSHIDTAIAVGQNNQDYFRWCGVPTENVLSAPHSVDTHRFGTEADCQHRAAEWRRQLGIGATEAVVLFAGKLQSKKDPSLLLEAFLELPGMGAHLLFVGNGELEADLKRRSPPGSRIHFLPFQNQSLMPAVYRVGDVFVLPSRGPGETWGLALNEAMASGRAVIASTKVGGARDLVAAGINGWVFDAGSVTSLTSTLRSAVSLGRDRLAQMGEAGRRMIRNWSTEAAAQGIAEAVTSRTRPKYELACVSERPVSSDAAKAPPSDLRMLQK
jgi:glycosyltransferase involved in cell wall biosynthesis